ncbi:MAG: hypothetical protein FWD05_02470 [Oscillospiraceae bacterium]|nr:hypothetical protein [Oscillospiraceae bacterium]
MKMLDMKTNNSVNDLTLLLKKEEAVQLLGYLEELLSEEGEGDHHHLNNYDYSKELTIALYDESNADNFSERYKLLISEDK